MNKACVGREGEEGRGGRKEKEQERPTVQEPVAGFLYFDSASRLFLNCFNCRNGKMRAPKGLFRGLRRRSPQKLRARYEQFRKYVR